MNSCHIITSASNNNDNSISLRDEDDLLHQKTNQQPEDSIRTLETTLMMDDSISTIDDHHPHVVRFAPQVESMVAYIPSVDDLSPQERRSVWWRQRHFAGFRQAAKIAAHNARVVEETTTGSHPVGGQRYLRARQYASLIPEDDIHTFLRNVVPEETTSAGGATTTARGLEHWTSKSHFHARRHAMKEARKVVLLAATAGISEDSIAQKYQEATRASRILARWMGEADALAVLVVAEQPTEQERKAISPPPPLTFRRTGIIAAEHKPRYQGRKPPMQHRGIA